MNLKDLRRRIDALDASLITLLNRRARISLDIAKVKHGEGKSVYSPEREQQVLQRVVRLTRGPLRKESIEAIYREIMSSSLQLAADLRVAYLGPEATFTHQAALKRFGSQVTFVSCGGIADVFSEVEKGNADFGVVPIENSIEGAVTHTLDMFLDADLNICAQIILDITHNLLSRSKSSAIKRVYSNPQVFGQCRIWLQQHLPNAERIEVSSTTRAAQIACRERSSSCIASVLAATVYGLKVVATDIEDSPHNITRFLVIGREEVPPTGKDKTSIMFSVKDRVGALHDMLLPFKKHHINLTKIESRPSKKKAWEYYFFVDLTGHHDTPAVKSALHELERKCTFLKILGSYPVGE